MVCKQNGEPALGFTTPRELSKLICIEVCSLAHTLDARQYEHDGVAQGMTSKVLHVYWKLNKKSRKLS